MAAASALFYILGLPAPAIGVATKFLSIAAALVNKWLAIQTVLTLESILISQAESYARAKSLMDAVNYYAPSSREQIEKILSQI